MSVDFKKRVALFVITIIAIAPAVGRSQAFLFGNLDGQIRIQGGDLGTARVQLVRLGMIVQEQFSTDGRFTFRSVAHGHYTLAVHVPGREPVSREIEVPSESYVLIEAGDSVSLPNRAVASVFELEIPRSARRQYERAQDRLRGGDCLRALKYLSEAIRLYQNYADAHNAVGNCEVQLQHPALAEEAFRQAIELTDSVYPVLNLADVYIKQSRLDEADAVLTRALRRDPTQGDAYFGLALVRVEQHRFDEAERLAEQAHEHPRHVEDVHLLLAKVHQRQGRLDLIPVDLEHYLDEAKPSPKRDRIEKMKQQTR
jgi:tetratricopeptide (TPR) repeat protein